MSESKKWYIFTFGVGQEHEGHYIKIYGTYDSAREKMFEMYGDKWAFQYDEERWQKWEHERPDWMKPEVLLMTIGEEDGEV